MKECSSCKELKNLSDFYKQKGRTTGVMSQCKYCASKIQKKRRDRVTNLIKRYKKMKGCEICGFKGHFAALELDHLDRGLKYKPLSRMKTNNIEKVKNEIRKCRVLCANCHAEHTYNQMSSRS